VLKKEAEPEALDLTYNVMCFIFILMASSILLVVVTLFHSIIHMSWAQTIDPNFLKLLSKNVIPHWNL
jgi:type IV secretory pathway VirB3-like protein